jgi:hypothetical protein
MLLILGEYSFLVPFLYSSGTICLFGFLVVCCRSGFVEEYVLLQLSLCLFGDHLVHRF